MKENYIKRLSFLKYQIRNSWKRVLLIFISSMGLISASTGISGIPPSASLFLITFCISLILGFISSFINISVIHIPDITQSKMLCHFCKAEDLREANDLTIPFYRKDSLDFKLIESWRKKNPNIFLCIKDGNELVASFSLIPIKNSFMDMFISGRVKEDQLTIDDIYDSTKDKDAYRLYIAGVIVKNPGTPKSRSYTRVMVWALINFYKKYYGTKKVREVYGLAATKGGEKFMKDLLFELISPKDTRKDGHDLLVKQFTHQSLKEIEEKIPDYCKICKNDF